MTDETRSGPSTIRMLFSILDGPTKTRLVLAALVSGVLAVLETVAIVTVLPLVGIATGSPVDDGAVGIVWEFLGRPSRETLGMALLAVVVGLFVGKDVFAIAFSWWQTGFVAERRVELSSRVFHQLLSESLIDHRKRNISEALRTMNAGVGQVFATLNALLNVIASALTIAAILVALLVATPVQALLALAYFGLAAVAYLRVVRPRIAGVGEDIMTGSTEVTLAGMQGLQGFKEVKMRNSSSFFERRYHEGLRRAEFASRAGNFWSSITKYLLEILFILAVGALLSLSFLGGSATSAVGSLALFVAAGFRLLPNISSMVGSINSLRVGRAAIELVRQEVDLDVPASIGHATEAGRAMAYERELVLEGVRFRYPDAPQEVLRGIDLRIPRGASVAFIGTSGAGKTTLVDIILGLIEPTSGRILVDGVDISGRIESWQRSCAMVAQNVFVAEDTIRKNVLFDVAPEDADREALKDAVERSQLGEVVEAMDGGLDADVGDWGARLSGGQRQRLGIARALYKRPSLLVLDEATSALDNETERRITETVEALHGETTVVIVAHRLSTVRRVDTVVFLEDGLISGIGGFDELRRANTGFRRLVELGDLGGSDDATA